MDELDGLCVLNTSEEKVLVGGKVVDPRRPGVDCEAGRLGGDKAVVEEDELGLSSILLLLDVGMPRVLVLCEVVEVSCEDDVELDADIVVFMLEVVSVLRVELFGVLLVVEMLVVDSVGEPNGADVCVGDSVLELEASVVDRETELPACEELLLAEDTVGGSSDVAGGLELFVLLSNVSEEDDDVVELSEVAEGVDVETGEEFDVTVVMVMPDSGLDVSGIELDVGKFRLGKDVVGNGDTVGDVRDVELVVFEGGTELVELEAGDVELLTMMLLRVVSVD